MTQNYNEFDRTLRVFLNDRILIESFGNICKIAVLSLNLKLMFYHLIFLEKGHNKFPLLDPYEI